jgi:hypothetical protein
MQKRKKSKISVTKCVLLVVVSVVVGYFRLVSLFLASNPDVSIANNVPQVYRKPRLQRYIQGWNITGNVSWLLDFSIVGFPKTGTSTLMLYLENQTESVFIFRQERCEMGWNQQVPLLVDLHKNYQPHLQMGIKCPRDLEIDLALKNYDTFFRTTKFIVGLRHPILWFQSFYNFRINNEFDMPPPQHLIGKCRKTHQGVCTVRANFSNHLEKIEPWRKVFLYDVAQLQDSNRTRARQFRQGLGSFLDLQTPLNRPMIHVKPGQTLVSSERAKELNALKIDICEDQYASLRQVLSKQASQSATWIRNVFLMNPNVKVASRDYFAQLLDAWHSDPCNTTQAKDDEDAGSVF